MVHGVFRDYEAIKKIPGGGMGVIYHVAHRDTGKEFAIKTVPSELHDDPDWKNKFLDEAVLMAKLDDHPHIVKLHKVTAEGDKIYLVMDYIPGMDLGKMLSQRGPLPFSESAEIFLSVAKALEYMHTFNIIHRDIKPANILISNEVPRQIKLVDFGIAKNLENQFKNYTNAGYGTLPYISPEHLRDSGATQPRTKGDDTVGPASDLYSLGIVLYEMSTGKTPFSDLSPIDIIRRKEDLNNPLELPLPDTVPVALTDILPKLLESDPRNRYQDAGILLQHWREKFPDHTPIPSDSEKTIQLPTGLARKAQEEAQIKITNNSPSLNSLSLRKPWLGVLITVMLIIAGGWFLQEHIIELFSMPPDSFEIGKDLEPKKKTEDDPIPSTDPSGTQGHNPQSPKLQPSRVKQEGLEKLRRQIMSELQRQRTVWDPLLKNITSVIGEGNEQGESAEIRKQLGAIRRKINEAERNVHIGSMTQEKELRTALSEIQEAHNNRARELLNSLSSSIRRDIAQLETAHESLRKPVRQFINHTHSFRNGATADPPDVSRVRRNLKDETALYERTRESIRKKIKESTRVAVTLKPSVTTKQTKQFIKTWTQGQEVNTKKLKDMTDDFSYYVQSHMETIEETFAGCTKPDFESMMLHIQLALGNRDTSLLQRLLYIDSGDLTKLTALFKRNQEIHASYEILSIETGKPAIVQFQLQGEAARQAKNNTLTLHIMRKGKQWCLPHAEWKSPVASQS
ncbi:MAG: hypothetical protein NPIRA04_05020 [Nitrospirales bacterium]|nr:MAG: hypothetical protein NPIRA04_05020 [Nitrospirales bacterium]